MRSLVLLLAVIPVFFISCQDPKRKAMDLKMEGIDLSYKNQFDQAIETLNRSLEYNNQDPETYFYLGTSYFGKKDKDKAFENYSKAIEVDSTFGQAYVNRGRMYKDRGDRDNACRDWLKAEACGIKSIKEETKFCK